MDIGIKCLNLLSIPTFLEFFYKLSICVDQLECSSMYVSRFFFFLIRFSLFPFIKALSLLYFFPLLKLYIFFFI